MVVERVDALPLLASTLLHLPLVELSPSLLLVSSAHLSATEAMASNDPAGCQAARFGLALAHGRHSLQRCEGRVAIVQLVSGSARVFPLERRTPHHTYCNSAHPRPPRSTTRSTRRACVARHATRQSSRRAQRPSPLPACASPRHWHLASARRMRHAPSVNAGGSRRRVRQRRRCHPRSPSHRHCCRSR